MPRPGIAAIVLEITMLTSNFPLTKDGTRDAAIIMIIYMPRARSRPGITPAINSRTIDVSVATP
jgi:hypothetical protein